MTNADAITRFVVEHRQRSYPAPVLDAAKQCLVDWLGVCLGAVHDPAAQAVHRVVQASGAAGRSQLLTGGTSSPALAALVNGTLSHCLDYDDTHIDTIMHGSGATWAAVLALGAERGATEAELLSAFITGFEVGARLGANGVGIALNASGWHSTGVLGRFSATVAACVLLDLDEPAVGNALAVAATLVGGLTASFGSMSKPLHAGKAAADGILAASLAAEGFVGATGLLDGSSGMLATLFQREQMPPAIAQLGEPWQVTRNSFKPYAACQLTHAVIDSALRLGPVTELDRITHIRARVNPMAVKLAGIAEPRTLSEAKFSIGYSIALGLTGRKARISDYDDRSLTDPQLRALTAIVECIPDERYDRVAGQVELSLDDGRIETDTTDLAYGSYGNSMTWPDLQEKFRSLVEPVLGAGTEQLLTALLDFETPGRAAELTRLLDSLERDAPPVPPAAPPPDSVPATI